MVAIKKTILLLLLMNRTDIHALNQPSRHDPTIFTNYMLLQCTIFQYNNFNWPMCSLLEFHFINDVFN